MSAPVFSVENISKTFRSSDGTDVHALAPTYLTIGEGEVVSVIGPSGCGKTALFNIISGLEEANTGQNFVDQHAVDGFRHRHRNVPDCGVI